MELKMFSKWAAVLSKNTSKPLQSLTFQRIVSVLMVSGIK